jgi:homoaconitase/3-isopropylmalate dehydratase large subunit
VELGAVSAVFDAEAGEAEPAGGLARLCLTTLVPLVARPGAPDAVVPVAELAGTRVDSAHIGSCASGGIEDLRAAARVLHGRHVAAGCVLYVTPATRSIYVQAMQEGVLAELSAAGAVILNPSCGACGGIDKGIPAAGEVMVTTAPRNYSSRARVGSEAYLASTATVAASAVKGALTDPRGLA